MHIQRSPFLVLLALVSACSSTPPKVTTPPPAKVVVQVEGLWLLTVNLPVGVADFHLQVKQTGAPFTCTLDSVDRSLAIHVDCNGTVNGSDINFEYEYDMQGLPLHVVYSGVTSGTEMHGAIVAKSQSGQPLGQGTFTAKRS